MNIYQLLEKYQKKRNDFVKSDEYRFFLNNRDMLNQFPKFSHFYDSDQSDFDIMKANCIIHGLINKALMEEEIENIDLFIHHGDPNSTKKFLKTFQERTVELPYFETNKTKIYIPFLSKAINLLYVNEPYKLLQNPYNDIVFEYVQSMVDPFDTYGAELFNSYFTRLIKVMEFDKLIAYFHYDTKTIYIVNNQGRLDSKIVLFDRYINKINDHHMLERIHPVLESYFAFDREEFLENLHKNGFISTKMFSIIDKKTNR